MPVSESSGRPSEIRAGKKLGDAFDVLFKFKTRV